METNLTSKPKGLASAQVAKALDRVNYQDGAVVSREVVKKPTGNLTIFAFDEGQGLSEHSAPFDALVQMIQGDAEITISGPPHRIRDGELLLMPANRPHGLRALTLHHLSLHYPSPPTPWRPFPFAN